LTTDYGLITDRTADDVISGTEKGFYNASDLNRIGFAVKDIARHWGLGILPAKDDWDTGDIPHHSDLYELYLSIWSLLSWVQRFGQPSVLPEFWFAKMNYEKANRLEQLIGEMQEILESKHISCYQSGEINCGEEVFGS